MTFWSWLCAIFPAFKTESTREEIIEENWLSMKRISIAFNNCQARNGGKAVSENELYAELDRLRCGGQG